MVIAVSFSTSARQVGNISFNPRHCLGRDSHFVYKGTWHDPLKGETECAVKVVKAQLQESIDREVTVLRQAGLHPNICAIYAVEKPPTDPMHYLALELCDETVLQWMERTPSPSLSQRVKVCRDIVRGVSFLHKHHVVHRDLKPSNVLMKGGVAKVADLGIAESSTGTDRGRRRRARSARAAGWRERSS